MSQFSTRMDLEATSLLIRSMLLNPELIRATFGGVVRNPSGSNLWQKIVIRPITIRNEPHLQFSYFDGRKDLSKNERTGEAEPRLTEILNLRYSEIHLSTTAEEVDVRISKKGKCLVRRQATAKKAKDTSHNRIKELPFPEGEPNRLLELLGIMTATGEVRASRRAKFTQINEFLKHLHHLLKQSNGFAEARRSSDALTILDCGCGSSYLTLAAHHFLNHSLGVNARVIGVDINEALIRKSALRASELDSQGLSFACGPIVDAVSQADVVVALHACNTATDDAIAQAIRCQAKLLLCVPCCHQALNSAFRAQQPAEPMRPLFRHGILRERLADLVTDSFRALALRIMGYHTDVVEFVDLEHSARNLMIRARRIGPCGEKAFVKEYLEMVRFWGVTPYIEQAIGNSFRVWVSDDSSSLGS